MDKKPESTKYFDIFTKNTPGAYKKSFIPASEPTSSKKSGNNQEETSKSNTPNEPADESLAQKLRPSNLEDFIGQEDLTGSKSILRKLIDNDEIVSMIFWGPPGSGKGTLAHLIVNRLKDVRIPMIKISGASSGIGSITEAVKTAVEERKSGFRTLVFMDEIHRFNKLQQDIFLPHVEAGTFILIGSTTENPSFCLNQPLLSRCRLFEFQKLDKSCVKSILMKGISLNDLIAPESIDWIVESSDGDARLAVNTLELSLKNRRTDLISIKKNFEEALILSNRKCDENKELVCALHQSIAANKPSAALYWLARLMAIGEDPVFIGKRLVRIAAEEVDFQRSDALEIAEHTISACQMVGMPECDVFLGQCTIYLCKAPKIHKTLSNDHSLLH